MHVLKSLCFFHNMRNYDGHLIIQNAEKLSNKKKIDEQNSQKFINDFIDYTHGDYNKHCKDHH